MLLTSTSDGLNLTRTSCSSLPFGREEHDSHIDLPLFVFSPTARGPCRKLLPVPIASKVHDTMVITSGARMANKYQPLRLCATISVLDTGSLVASSRVFILGFMENVGSTIQGVFHQVVCFGTRIWRHPATTCGYVGPTLTMAPPTPKLALLGALIYASGALVLTVFLIFSWCLRPPISWAVMILLFTLTRLPLRMYPLLLLILSISRLMACAVCMVRGVSLTIFHENIA